MKGLFKKGKKEKTEPSNAHEYSLGFNMMENILNGPFRHDHPTLPSTSTALVQMQVGHSGSGPSASTLGHTTATTNPTAIEHKSWNKREQNQISSSVSIGQEKAFNKVRDCLTKSDVGIVGIHGMGGVGKTTLMKKVCYEFLKPSNFKVIWIVVSKTVNEDNIQKSIMRDLNLSFYEDQDPQARGMVINETLFNGEVKVALLLHDIWEALDLDQLGVAAV